MAHDPIVIAGAGVAGVACADALRSGGFEGRVVLLDADPGPPYDRPPLTKELLAADVAPERPLLRGAEHWERSGIELLPGRRVAAVDAGARRVALDDGERIAYSQLVLATGLAARRPPLGGRADDALVVRTYDDALALRRALDARPRVLVLGAGFVGAEVASAARARGLEVTVVELAPQPMARVLGESLGAVCGELLRGAGVELRCGVSVERIEGTGRVESALLSDGTTIEADLVVAAAGTVALPPPLDGAAHADGVPVDAALGAASGVWAVGDVAVRIEGGIARRAEQWTNAVEQGRHVAGALLGRGDPAPYAKAPYAWSQQFGRMVQVAGELRDADEVRIVAGDGRPLALARRGGLLVGAFGVDQPRGVLRARGAIERGTSWEDALAER